MYANSVRTPKIELSGAACCHSQGPFTTFAGSQKSSCMTLLLGFLKSNHVKLHAVTHRGHQQVQRANGDDALPVQFERDPDGFGVNTIPDPPLQRTSSNASEASTISLGGTSASVSRFSQSDSDSCASSYSRVPRRRHRKQARKDAGPLGVLKVAAFTLCAAGLITAVAQRGGVLPGGNQPDAAKSGDKSGDKQQRPQQRKHRGHPQYAAPLNQVESLETVWEEED